MCFDALVFYKKKVAADIFGGCFFIREHGRVSLATLFSGTHERK